MIEISIIIPMYNAENSIGNTINSLVNSARKYGVKYEIIIVDDGSYDKSSKVVYNAMKDYDRIYYYFQENNKQGSARNKGLSYAKGLFVSFVDADDYVDIDYLEIFQNWKKLIEYDYIYFNYTRVSGKYNKERILIGENHVSFVCCNSYKKMFFPASPVLAFYNTKFLKLNNIKFLEGVQFEDIHFNYIVQYHAKKVMYLDKFLYFYVIHNNSTVRSRDNRKNLDLIVVFENIIKLDNNLENKDIIEYLAVQHLYLGGMNRILINNSSKEQFIYYETTFLNFMNRNFKAWDQNKLLSLKQKIQLRLLKNHKHSAAFILVKINVFSHKIKNITKNILSMIKTID